MASSPAPAPFPTDRFAQGLSHSTIPSNYNAHVPSSPSRTPRIHTHTTMSSQAFENPKAYNNLATAYNKRVGTAASSSSRTAFGPDDAHLSFAQAQQGSRQRIPSGSSTISPTVTSLPSAYPANRAVPTLESRVFGLTPDLREPVPSPASSEVSDVNRMARLLDGQKPNFSVEVFAPSFDHRGYPVLSGRAASVRGVIRMPAMKGCDVMMTISAHTTTGSPAAAWQGTPLAPYSTGAEKKVFEIQDRLIANYDLVRPRASYAPKNEELMEPPQISNDDLVLPIPFDISLPMGKATRFIDGEMQTVPVSLPPSFEISSKKAAQEKRDIRLATKGKARGPLAKELIEKGFERVYQIGCYYQINWTVIRPDSEGKSKKSKSSKEPAEGDSLTLPFIFLGEPTSMPPHPPTLPSSISPNVFLEDNCALGDRWDIHKSQAKWSGSLLKASKKTVDIELHIPNPPVLQAPSVLPIMLVLRPADPTLLSAVKRTRTPSESSTAPGSPSVKQQDDPIETVISPDSSGRQADTESIKTTRSIVSKLIKPSMSLARMQGSSSRKSGSSVFGGRRPNTAPSPGSSEAGVTDAMTDRTYMPSGAIPELVNLVCISLIQTTFSSNDNVNDGPEHRRKLLSVADLEEVDVHALLLNSDSSGSQPGSRPGSSRSPEEMTAINEAVAATRAAGVRVLVGTLRIAGATPPSFRCHGLEVKYALKVDLLPANRFNSADGVERALEKLGIGSGRNRGFSDAMSTTASVHTQTQFTQLSGDGSSPPTTPPWQVAAPSVFGARSPPSDNGPASRSWTRQIGSRNGSPLSPVGNQGIGMAISTHDESAIPADMVEKRELLSAQSPTDPPSRFGNAVQPYPRSYPQGRATPSIAGTQASNGLSLRTGWGSGNSVSEYSQVQSSIYMSEWGRDRKTVSKINKTIGEMWIDVRLVRGFNSY